MTNDELKQAKREAGDAAAGWLIALADDDMSAEDWKMAAWRKATADERVRTLEQP